MKLPKLKWSFFVVLGSMLLSACGALPQSSWPGVAADPQNKFIYAAYASGVFKVDITNGNMVWRYPEKADAAMQFYAAPASDSKGLVVIGDYGVSPSILSEKKFSLIGLDSETRAQKWTNTDAKDQWVANPLIVNNLVVAPSADGNVYALSPTDGKVVWKFSAAAAFWSKPVSDGKIVYVSSMDHHLYALNLSNGSLVWKTDLGAACVYGVNLASDGNIYLSTLGNEVLALTANRGDIIWRFPTTGSPWAVPVLNDGIVYVGDLSNKIYAISASSGKATWQVDAPGPIASSPAVTSQGLIFASEDGAVFGVNFSGQKEWNQTINGKLYSAPVLAGDTVVVGVTSGDKNLLLVTFDASGKQIWAFTVPQ
jgi:outer membrane protein assembly factor BamB